MNSSHSTTILSVLRQVGIGEDDIRRTARLSSAALRAVAGGEREFTDAELKRIEQATGKTIGQLAAAAVEPKGGAFKELMESWAEFSQLSQRSAAHPKKIRRKTGTAL